MGYDWCTKCEKKDYRDELMFGCCSKDRWGGMCSTCGENDVGNVECGKCKDMACYDHGHSAKQYCCGLFFCAPTEDDNGDDDCISSHIQKHSECGHLSSCNFNKGRGGCIICETEGDMDLAKDLKNDCNSPSLKLCLSKWLAESQKLCKKANKEKKESSTKTKQKSTQVGKKRKSRV
mmetsp:Transcript_7693/g.17411  ORF Transcript_7693/g.17411 Transcript_7693/m.17411 type:complete len:177 (+) Transcript_7693:129-659(+)